MKTNCSYNEKELFDFMKNRVDEKMESLGEFDKINILEDFEEE